MGRVASGSDDAIPSRSHPVGAPTAEKKARMACQKVRVGEVSRARQCLTGASVAPGTQDTFQELQDRRPQVQHRELPREVLEFVPERPVDLDRKTFFDSLRSAPRGSSAGPGGCTCEHLKLMLDDTVVGNVQSARTRQSACCDWDSIDGSPVDRRRNPTVA